MFKFRLGLVVSSLFIAAVMLLNNGNASPASVAHAQGPEGGNAAVAWDTDGNKATNKAFLGTTNNKPLVLKANGAEQMRILPNGKVGIGVTNPTSRVEIAAQDGLSITGYQPFITLRDTNANNARALLSTGNGDFGVYPESHIGNFPPLLVKNGTGNVGINNPSPAHTLEVVGDFEVKNGSGLYSLFVGADRTVSVGELAPATTSHLCRSGAFTLAYCNSAAEYVPSIDAGKGFPQTADLVSIAPQVKNPYGDAHGPFVVQKSPKACDENLLGFIVKPESGADGVHLNDHYLPLAIYGFFPAKVTMENGAIQRGDAITSSSKAGYGMKATDACKVIGYALQDATADGTIQVFANFGDNASAQVRALHQENDALKQMLSKFETRLAALEGTAPVAMRVTDSLATVKGYYAALQSKDIATALGFLADDVVMPEINPAPNSTATVKGVQAAANALKSSEVLSFSVEDFRADGNRVTYAMTQWLDPRRVGMNYPQPRKSHLTAVVADGKIVSITETLDAGLALRTK